MFRLPLLQSSHSSSGPFFISFIQKPSVSRDYFLAKLIINTPLILILDPPTTYIEIFFFRSCPFWHQWVFGSFASDSLVVSSVQSALSLLPTHCWMPSITFVSFSSSFTPHWIILSDYINLSDKRLTQSFHNLLQTCFVLFELKLNGSRDEPPPRIVTCNVVYCPGINPAWLYLAMYLWN